MAGDGYTNQVSNNYNLTPTAEGRNLEIDIDGTNKSFLAAGLNPECLSSGGGTRSTIGEVLGIKRGIS